MTSSPSTPPSATSARWAAIQSSAPGILIDIEPFGEEVVQRLKAEKVTCILGNHDRWALQFRHRRQDARKFFEPCSVSDVMGSGAELSHESLVWLSTLPVHWEAELEGVLVAMWHARPGSDMEGIEKERTGPELQHRLLEQARARILVVGHTHTEFELMVNVPAGKILNPGACCSKTYAFKSSGSLAVADGFRPATFGVLELPSTRFKVYRALDGERVFGTSPDRPCFRAPRRTDG